MSESILVKENSYYDSVVLMELTSRVKELDGITDTFIGMATPHNLELMEGIGFHSERLQNLNPNDLIIAVRAMSDEKLKKALHDIDSHLEGMQSEAPQLLKSRPKTLKSALRIMPDADLALISVPGPFAAREAQAALDAGMHVMLFSDNVDMKDEVKLKKQAIEKGLLMMGQGCGTALINGAPLGFVNELIPGSVGLVGSSGTGLQEVSCTLERFGSGVSQILGVGSHDLSPEAGGIMSKFALDYIDKDSKTQVIVFVGRPAAEAVQKELIAKLESLNYPVVAHFMGMKQPASNTVKFCDTLEETGRAAACIDQNRRCASKTGAALISKKMKDFVNQRSKELAEEAVYVRGLFSGGSLCSEAVGLLLEKLPVIYSNTGNPGTQFIPGTESSREHTMLDMGEDEFTKGKAHPMIDYSYRIERFLQEIEDPETAIILFDVVLGYGSHPDPASVLVPAIYGPLQARRDLGNPVLALAVLLGTEQDPQKLTLQQKLLEDAGVFVFRSNAQAAYATGLIMEAHNRQRSEK